MKLGNTPERIPGAQTRSKSHAIETVKRLEKRVWKVAQQRNAAEFAKLVSADAVIIFQSGVILQPEYWRP